MEQITPHELGIIAFYQKRPRNPGQDEALIAQLGKIGENEDKFLEWGRGWDEAQSAAPRALKTKGEGHVHQNNLRRSGQPR